MTRKTRLVLWVIAFVVVSAGFVWCQMWQLSRGLRTLRAGKTEEEILLSALSAQVLAPDLGGDGQSAAPLLEQHREAPLTHQRYLLVVAWLHANQIFRAIKDWSAFEANALSSDSLTRISADTRVDGWATPYCIWVEPKQVVFISSAGSGAPDCEALQQTAQEVAKSHDGRLTRFGKLLVIVQERSTDAGGVND